jgi:hypothetical protein
LIRADKDNKMIWLNKMSDEEKTHFDKYLNYNAWDELITAIASWVEA